MIKGPSSQRVRIGMGTVAGLTLLYFSSPAFADAPIWANAKVVKATQSDCGPYRYLVFKGNAVREPTPPDTPDCKSTEMVYRQINVSKAFFRPEGKGLISEHGVDAATLLCSNGDALIIVGRGREVNFVVRRVSAPPGCAYSMSRLQHLSSIGSIAFTDVANGGTMSVKESLAYHAEERRKIIAECNASAACRAEMSRISRENAIAEYDECMNPAGLLFKLSDPFVDFSDNASVCPARALMAYSASPLPWIEPRSCAALLSLANWVAPASPAARAAERERHCHGKQYGDGHESGHVNCPKKLMEKGLWTMGGFALSLIPAILA